MQLKSSLFTPVKCALCSYSLARPKPFSSSFAPWRGLQSWRDGPLNEDRRWGSNGPEPLPSPQSPPYTDSEADDDPTASASSLSELGALVLSTSDPLAKSRLSHLAFSRWRRERLGIGVAKPPDRPARPPKPYLVSPKEIPAPKQSGLPLNAYMLHNLAHVELNAIDLAWDTVVRFPAPKQSGLPLNAYMLHNLAHVELNAIDLAWDTVVRFSSHSDVLGEGFFDDFAHVADDESRHFSWCSQRLAELGFSYGDMPAHNLLWRECEKSSGDVAARLAIIPMVQEARGLDAGPRLVQKLVGFGDCRTSRIVGRIAEEEVAHVAIGVFWFMLVCEKLGRVPCTTFKDLLKEYEVELKGPFNYSARDEAGIPRAWYDESFMAKVNKAEQLSEVYERLACIISMEKENSSLNTDAQ